MLQKNMLWWDTSLSGIIFVPCNDVFSKQLAYG